MIKHLASRCYRQRRFGSRLSLEPLESRQLLSTTSWSIDDQLSLEDGQLTVVGTDSMDAFEFTAGTEYSITLNGETRQYSLDSVDTITFDAGEEDLVVLHDTEGNDTIQAAPGATQLTSDGLTVEVLGAGEVVVYADSGGVDDAHLTDSAGDDVFVSSPTSAELSGDLYSIRVDSFEFVHAYARLGGNDRAEMTGSDGEDLLVARDTWSRLMGDGYSTRVKFFDELVVYAGDGSDQARLYDSSGVDYLLATPEEATFSGETFSNSAVGFDSVAAYSDGGGDWAELVDSEGDDTLHATVGQTTLFGSDYINRAIGFTGVHAYARRGGYDIANLHDSDGNDSFIGYEQLAKLSGDGFLIRAKFFDSVHAYADSDGYDTAQLIGSDGDDTFESRSTHSWLRGDDYEYRVGTFDYVLAKADAGNDEALIYDSEAVDQVDAELRSVRLSEGESGIVRQAVGFDIVTTELTQTEDAANVAETIVIDVRIERPGTVTTIDATTYLDSSSPTWGLQDAIDALPEEGGGVLLPAGTYTLRQGLVLRDGVTLQGSEEGTVLIRPDRVESTLTATATIGDASIEVASVEGFQVGDDVAILAYGQSNVGHRTIVKIEDGRLYLDEPIAVDGTFAPESGASVVNYFPMIRAAWAYEGVETSDIAIDGITIDGNLDETTEAWRISGPALIQLENVSDAVIRNTTVLNGNCGGILVYLGHDILIEDTTVDTFRGHGIAVHGVADPVISGVTSRNAGFAERGDGGDGIFVTGCSDAFVTDSLAEGNSRHGLHPGGALNRGGVWSNNVSRGNGDNGFHFCWDNFDILVVDNVLESNGRYGVGGLGLGGSFGDYFNTVQDNLIRNNQRDGIQINGGSDNTIIGNTIVDNSQRRTGRYSGIFLVNSSYVLVAANTIGTTTSTPPQAYGVIEVGVANDNFIISNDASGNIESGVLVSGITTIVHNNSGGTSRVGE